MNASYQHWCQQVKEVAAGQWPGILQSLAGLEDQQINVKQRHKGAPCPVCNAGQDRFSFKSEESGGWACRHCGGGDGFTLLQRVNGWSFHEALKAVSGYLHIEYLSDSPISPEQQETNRKRAIQRRYEAEQRQQAEALKQQADHDRKAIYALTEWNNANPADPLHPYLVSHCLEPFDLRQIQHPVYGWCLLVPLFNEQWQLRNCERINPDGMKRPIKGAQKKDCFYQFGRQTWTLYICEGWATGAAIHLSQPWGPCVLCAMSRTNLEAVAAIALRLYPDSDLVIAADHDPAGIADAIAVASHYGLKIVLPSAEGQDFCDSHIQQQQGAGYGH